LEAYLHVWTSEGIELTGELALGLTQIAPDGEEGAECAGSDGDFDGDGSLDTYFDGDDCDDDDSLTGPGFAYLDGVDCMTDADGDGWGNSGPGPGVIAGTDCRDSDASIFPGAVTEAIDGECMEDVDGDGFGDLVPPEGFDAGTDCDDTVASSYPGATEVIGDNVDSDCDGGEICYIDADDDGWRPDSTSTIISVDSDCFDSMEATDAVDMGDCDDSSAGIHPGAVEIAADSVDSDCDGTEVCYVDADDDGARPDGTSTVVSADGDCMDAGEAVATDVVGDCDDADPSLNLDDGDGDGYSTCDDDCDDGDATVHPGATDLLLTDRDCVEGIVDNSLTLANYTFVGEGARVYAGYSVSSAGDVDGDSLDDILVGAPGASASAGKAYLILGASLGTTSEIDLSLADYSFVGEDTSVSGLSSVSSAGDVDGDGLDDILVGNPGTDAGKAYLILGASLGSTSTIDLSAADYTFVGENVNDRAGYPVSSAGDVDGDGLDDILVGAVGNDDGGYNAGKAYLILGASLGSTSTIDLSDADYSFVGEESWDNAGSSVSSAGDVDGDGLDDLLVGAPSNDDGGYQAGKVYLILGVSLGGSSAIDLSTADYYFVGEAANSLAGSAVSSAGDVDGDGFGDLIVGAPSDSVSPDPGGGGGTPSPSSGSTAYRSKTYVILGASLGPDSELNLSDSDYQFLGAEVRSDGYISTSDSTGVSVALAGDVDGDGLSDLIIGAIGFDRTEFAEIYPGSAYLILGASLGASSEIDLLSLDSYTFMGENNLDEAGRSVSCAGDVNGDGLDDLLVGAPFNDDGGDRAGKAYLIFSGL
jgi:hypothetical protein